MTLHARYGSILPMLQIFANSILLVPIVHNLHGEFSEEIVKRCTTVCVILGIMIIGKF